MKKNQVKTHTFIICLLSVVPGLAVAQDGGLRVNNDSAASLVVANGNSKSQSYSLSHETKLTWPMDSLKVGLKYLQSRSGDVDSAKNHEGLLRYERVISDSLSGFVGQNFEGNTFAGFKQRYNTDVGAKFFFRKETAKDAKDKDLNWFAESGYRFIRTNPNSGASETDHALRLYHEIEKQLNEAVSVKHGLEFIPSLKEGKNWLLNSDLSLNAALNSIFSAKVSFLVKHDNFPTGGATVKTDTLLTTGLVAKF